MAQLRFDRAGNARCYSVLQFEDVVECTVETVGPDMRPGCRVYQLPRYTHAVSSFANRAFQHVTNAQFAGYLLYVNRPALVGEAGISSDDEEPRHSGDHRRDLLNHAVSEIFLVGVAAHVLERQHRYGRLVRERQGRSAVSSRTSF